MPRISSGVDSETAGLSVAQLPYSARQPRMNPMKVEPESPRKILAGRQFIRRKPKQAPASAAEMKESGYWFDFQPIPRNSRAQTAPMVEARPSMPSMKLKALIIPTSQITERTVEIAMP